MRAGKALEEAFKKADTDGDGKLTVDEYYKVLQDHNIKTSKEEILRLIEFTESGFITPECFLGHKPATVEERAETAFNIIDKNHDGFITKKEMAVVAKRLTLNQIDAVFERNDKDKDGRLSKKEFTDMM